MIFCHRKTNQSYSSFIFSPWNMAILRKKQKFAALNKEKCAKHPRSNQAQSTNVPRSQKNCISQVLGEIEVRVTKKLCKEIKRMESRILGALSRLDEFLLNPGSLRIRYGDVQEQTWQKPGNEWRRLPEWSSSWSERLSEKDYTRLWLRWCSWQKQVQMKKWDRIEESKRYSNELIQAYCVFKLQTYDRSTIDGLRKSLLKKNETNLILDF